MATRKEFKEAAHLPLSLLKDWFLPNSTQRTIKVALFALIGITELFRIAFTESYDLLLTAMVKTLIFAPCVVKVLPPRVSEKHLFYYLPRLG